MSTPVRKWHVGATSMGTSQPGQHSSTAAQQHYSTHARSTAAQQRGSMRPWSTPRKPRSLVPPARTDQRQQGLLGDGNLALRRHRGHCLHRQPLQFGLERVERLRPQGREQHGLDEGSREAAGGWQMRLELGNLPATTGRQHPS